MFDITTKNSSKWYSSLKGITSHGEKKKIKSMIQDINCLSDEEQAHKLADHFSTNSSITISSSLENSESTLNKQIHSQRGHTSQNL